MWMVFGVAVVASAPPMRYRAGRRHQHDYQSGFINFSERAGCRADRRDIFLLSMAVDTGRAIGTSCATPLWRVIGALVNQQALANGNRSVGSSIRHSTRSAKTASYTNCFHGQPHGANNTWDQKPNLFFRAVPATTLQTGLGTPKRVLIPDRTPLAGNGFKRPRLLARSQRVTVIPAHGSLSG